MRFCFCYGYALVHAQPPIMTIMTIMTKMSRWTNGNNPKKWRTNISSFNTIEFGEIYKGVNLKLRASGNNVEKIFYIQPNINPDVIKINIESAENVTINTKGELEVRTELGNVCFTKPVG